MITVHEAAILSEAVYSPGKQPGLKDWQILTSTDTYGLSLDGHYSCAYVNNNSKVIAIGVRGTDPSFPFWNFIQNVGTDINIYLERDLVTYRYAKEFTDNVIKLNKDQYTIVFIGHSLGGAYAIMLGIDYNERVIALDTVAPDSLTKLIQKKFHCSPDKLEAYAKTHIISIVAPETFISKGQHLGQVHKLTKELSSSELYNRRQDQRLTDSSDGIGLEGLDFPRRLGSEVLVITSKHGISKMCELIKDTELAKLSFPVPMIAPPIVALAKRGVLHSGGEPVAGAAGNSDRTSSPQGAEAQVSDFITNISVVAESTEESSTKTSNTDSTGKEKIEIEEMRKVANDVIKTCDTAITKLKNEKHGLTLDKTMHVLANLVYEYQQIRSHADAFKDNKAALLRKIEDEASWHNVRIELSDTYSQTHFTLPEIRTEITARTHMSYSLSKAHEITRVFDWRS